MKLLYFKKALAWLKGCFSLVGLVSFFAGVYSLALVDLFYFSNEITPPAFSAAFAGGALILAGYTAIKVNRWINGKINETAFKRSEDFLTCFSQQMMQIETLFIRIDLLLLDTDREDYTQNLKKMNIEHEKTFKIATEAHAKLATLESWGVVFKQKKAYVERSTKLIGVLGYIEGFLLLRKSKEFTIDDNIRTNINTIKSKLRSIHYVMESIENIKFKDKINFTSHVER